MQRSDSVVTVMGFYQAVDNIDHRSVIPEEHISWWAHLITPMINMGGLCATGIMDLPIS